MRLSKKKNVEEISQEFAEESPIRIAKAIFKQKKTIGMIKSTSKKIHRKLLKQKEINPKNPQRYLLCKFDMK